MAIVRPRLNDYFDIPFTQDEVSFAIPFLDEDIPLYVDPFLLYASPSQQDHSLHLNLISVMNRLGRLYQKGDDRSISIIINASECDEVGLGNSKTKVGRRIGEKTAIAILDLYKNVPQIGANGLTHLEEIQLLVENVSKDRISDITCSFIKSFLIDSTIQECRKYKIPTEEFQISIFDVRTLSFRNEVVPLPYNPESELPIILVPKRWLRFVPFINFDEYFNSAIYQENSDRTLDRVDILEYNRHNYGLIEAFVRSKELEIRNCKSDPLFNQIPITSAKRKLKTILGLPTGKVDNADKSYEDNMVQLLASMLYPHLDFAKEQSRIESGSQIRDLIFYNNRSFDFLKDIYDDYECRQLVVELKNVAEVEREHINQVNRYLTNQFGRFGVIFTRKRPPKKIYQNTIDLWAGQRRSILILDDEDLKLMCEVYESKQRLPIEVIKKKYVEFTRSCPS
ncbi:hypothetical protein [Larkinella punicea]|uniref:Restriction endonuclease type IV Mrr domain-containing protein n=1 Tax=Larkinella punicea TaxID=2315727 RepID=A0A368JK68_9BACT|nr:hypothetical protein [Larkinella punicea]RCR67446.1 hypothetical protein DUE52_21840 [Larkinella punicea]